MLQNIAAINIYSDDLAKSLHLYKNLGLELRWMKADGLGAGSTLYRFGMRFPGGGPELVLHNNPQQQFPYPTVAVEDTHQAYQLLSHDPDYLWCELPHSSQRGCAALVRAPDGTVFSLLSPHREQSTVQAAVSPQPSHSVKEIQL